SLFGGASQRRVQPFSKFYFHNRYPFIDDNYLKILLSVPLRYLKEYKLFLYIMNRYHSDLMSIPFATSRLSNDKRVNTVKKGTHSFTLRRRNYYNYMKRCAFQPILWNKKNYSIYTNAVLRSRGFINTIFKGHNVKGRRTFGIIKLLDFDGWLRKYYLH
ncbi:hypothetical protein ACFLTD_02345, partial [Elusimicrobiota bacterium]